MAVPLIVDLYHGDAVTSFQTARDAGLLAVIHKATTGATGRDDAYKSRRQLARAANLLWGAYHWGTNAPVEDQVSSFLEWAEPDAKTLMVLDYERTGGNQMTLAQAQDFLTLLGEKLARKPIIYGGALLKENLGNNKDSFFGGHRLWLAQYGNHPRVQASWDNFWLWQYTDGADGPDPKTVPGIPGNNKGLLDCSHYVGTAEKLAEDWSS
jgi:GH25 family lysozyme M1 (1,4-beta-N-acetylmuramidase)